MPSGAVLRLEDIHESYNIGEPVEVEILHGIDFSNANGEFIALVGPSGSGKSTLLNIIGLLEAPTADTVEIARHPLGYDDDDNLTRLLAASLSFVFQFPHLLPSFSALENVLMPELVRGAGSAAETRAHALALLASVGLAGAENKMPSERSGDSSSASLLLEHWQ